jgi:hypothetical protein
VNKYNYIFTDLFDIDKCLNTYLLKKKDYKMKKILILILLVLFCSGSVFGGFKDTLKKTEQGDVDSQWNVALMYDNPLYN